MNEWTQKCLNAKKICLTQDHLPLVLNSRPFAYWPQCYKEDRYLHVSQERIHKHTDLKLGKSDKLSM
jgi:hypothetical protein